MEIVLALTIHADIKNKDAQEIQLAVEEGLNMAMSFIDEQYKPDYLSYNINRIAEL